MKAITVQQMRDLDRRTIEEAGVPGYVLMERAGFGCGEKIIEFIEDRIDFRHVKRFVILAGKGNNGGDGYVVARYLYENTDIEIVIYSICASLGLTVPRARLDEKSVIKALRETQKNMSEAIQSFNQI
jgi:NAD(P)H-hydrate epimerase